MVESRSVETTSDRLAGPTDPFGLRWLSSGLCLLRRPLSFLCETERRYGPLSGIPGNQPRIVFAFGPEQVRQLLTGDGFLSDSFRHLRLPPGSPMMLLTSGLLRLNGTVHRRHRQAMHAAFSPRHVAVYTGTILRLADEMIGAWRPGRTIDLHDTLATLVTRVSLATMAGLEDRVAAEYLHRKMAQLASAASHPLTPALQKPWPGTPFRRMTRLAADVEQILRELIAGRRRITGNIDLLSGLVSPKTDGTERLTDEELLGEAYTALCHDSVASSLCWTLVLLDQHRRWWEAVRAEVSAVLGSKDPDPTALERMPVLDSVLKESLRLMPPASFAVRYADEGAEIDGHFLRPGAMVIASSFVTHRNAYAFPEPLRFGPDRWASMRPPQHVYFPFGLGPHNCIGRNLALLEIKLVLVRIMQRGPLVLSPGAVVDPVVRISTVPAAPIEATVLAPADPAPPRVRISGSLTQVIEL